MINFRFHLVSIIAVFLALGLGILVGSTVVDQGIVNRLDSEISRVRKENGERKTQSERLVQQNSQLQNYIDQIAPFVGDARLDGQSVAIIAQRGVDGGVVKATQALLRAAGADVPAVLWLEESWQLDTTERTDALRSALDVSGDPSTMRQQAFALLARRLALGPPASTTSTSTSTSSPTVAAPVDVLAALEQANFIGVSNGDASTFDAFPVHLAHALIVTGDDSHLQGTDTTPQFVRGLIRAKVPTVVAAAYDATSDKTNPPARGAALASVIDDKVLSKAVSTLDDLELSQGQVVAVLALEAVGNGNVGHYGYGVGASAPVPAHRS